MTRFKKIAREVWQAWLEIWGLNLLFYKRIGHTIAGWPAWVKRWWLGLYEREWMRRTRRIHELHVWIKEPDESMSDWISHYFQEPDLSYGGLTSTEADQLGDEMIADGHALGMQLQVRTVVNRKYV